MERFTVNLPEDLDAFVEARVADGRWATKEDYLRALVEDDRERGAELRRLLQEGEDSGISSRSVEEIFAQAARHAERAAQ